MDQAKPEETVETVWARSRMPFTPLKQRVNERRTGLWRKSGNTNERLAFTLIELLAVGSVLLLIGFLLVPALTRTQSGARAFQCLNNHRQLTTGWRMFATENNDFLVTESAGLVAQPADLGHWEPEL